MVHMNFVYGVSHSVWELCRTSIFPFVQLDYIWIPNNYFVLSSVQRNASSYERNILKLKTTKAGFFM